MASAELSRLAVDMNRLVMRFATQSQIEKAPEHRGFSFSVHQHNLKMTLLAQAQSAALQRGRQGLVRILDLHVVQA